MASILWFLIGKFFCFLFFWLLRFFRLFQSFRGIFRAYGREDGVCLRFVIAGFLFLAAIGSVCFCFPWCHRNVSGNQIGFPRCGRNKIYAFIGPRMVIIKYSPVFHCCFFQFHMVSFREFQSCKIILDIKGLPFGNHKRKFRISNGFLDQFLLAFLRLRFCLCFCLYLDLRLALCGNVSHLSGGYCRSSRLQELILSRLVDTFFSRISPTMQLPPKHHSIAYVLPWAEGLHWQSRSSGCSNS